MHKSRRVDDYSPSLISAFRTVADNKWEDYSFQCLKCGNSNYREGKRPFSRRCTSCKKDHSPTVGTVFEKVKLPLDVCLDIVELICQHIDKLTINEIVEIFKAKGVAVDMKATWQLVFKIYRRMAIEPKDGKSERLLLIGMYEHKWNYCLCEHQTSSGKWFDAFEFHQQSHLVAYARVHLHPDSQASAFIVNRLGTVKQKITRRELPYPPYTPTPEKIVALAFELKNSLAGVAWNSEADHRQALANRYVFLKNGLGLSELMTRLCK